MSTPSLKIHFVKKMMCCQGRNSSERWNLKPNGSSSDRTSCTDILCNGWIGTLGSSLRNSTRTTRPSGFSASLMCRIIETGSENSWYTSTIKTRSSELAGSFGSVGDPQDHLDVSEFAVSDIFSEQLKHAVLNIFGDDFA